MHAHISKLLFIFYFFGEVPFLSIALTKSCLTNSKLRQADNYPWIWKHTFAAKSFKLYQQSASNAQLPQRIRLGYCSLYFSIQSNHLNPQVLRVLLQALAHKSSEITNVAYSHLQPDTSTNCWTDTCGYSVIANQPCKTNQTINTALGEALHI